MKFEAFTAVTMKNAVFGDDTLCGSVALLRTDVSEEHFVFEEWCLLGCYAVWLL
jgi:hypothetical protein